MTDISLAMGAVRRADRVVLASLGLFAVLLLLVPTQAYDSLIFTADSLVFIAPFLLASVLVAASVKATGLDRQIAVVFSGRQTPVIFTAALFGALSPFCSIKCFSLNLRSFRCAPSSSSPVSRNFF